jgi:tetratricopeptide (TPR) repeat protein
MNEHTSRLNLLRSRWHFIRATTHRHWGNRNGVRIAYERAVDAFTRAIECDAQFTDAYFQRGKLYWREIQNYYRAIRDMSRVLELDPEYHEALFNRALAYQQRGDYDEAIADLENFLAADPQSTWRDSAELQLAGMRDIRDARNRARNK